MNTGRNFSFILSTFVALSLAACQFTTKPNLECPHCSCGFTYDLVNGTYIKISKPVDQYARTFDLSCQYCEGSLVFHTRDGRVEGRRAPDKEHLMAMLGLDSIPDPADEKRNPDVRRQGGRIKPATVESIAQRYSPEVIISNFEAGDEGWRLENAKGQPPIPRPEPDIGEEGGNLGGFVWFSGGHSRFWIAPEKFLGDQSSAYGGWLLFDLFSVGGYSTEYLLTLEGAGLRLQTRSSYNVMPAWTHYAIRLDETVNWSKEDGSRARAKDLVALLSSLEKISIAGGHHDDKAGLDNVVLLPKGSERSRPPSHGIISAFDSGKGGWAVGGHDSGGSGFLDCSSDGGNPGGYVFTEGTWARHLIPPPCYRGDFSEMYGGRLSFDLNPELYYQGNEGVILEGGGLRLICYHEPLTKSAWKTITMKLDVNEKWFVWREGQPFQRAKETEFRKVLANLGQIKILAGFYTGITQHFTGITRLDNFSIEPAAQR